MENDLVIQSRELGELVPEGLSVAKPYEGKNLHVVYQKTLSEGKVLRVRITIPKVTMEKTETWIAGEVIYDREVKHV